MLGGHIRHQSIRSLVKASPCARVEKWKQSTTQGIQIHNAQDDSDPYDSPNKARIIKKPLIASTFLYQFSGERMIKAQRGVLERQSLEDNCLSADGEEMSSDCKTSFRFLTMLHY
jgi:hypothetical protein